MMPRSEEEIIIMNKVPVIQPDIIEQATKVIDDSLFLEPKHKKNNYELNRGLRDEELAEATALKPYVYGMMIVTGKPGAGKDLFANWLAWKIRRYFMGRHILRDEKPYPLFGPYKPFTPSMLWQQIKTCSKSKALEKTEDDIYDLDTDKGKKREELIGDIVEGWSQTKGRADLAYSVLYCVEFTSYLHNRRGMTDKSMAFSNIIRRWRHYPMLIIGTTQNQKELDKNLCLNFVTHDARCAWHTRERADGSIEKWTLAHIYRVQAVGETGVLNLRDAKKRPGKFSVHPDVPHWQLGGKSWGDLYESEI